MYTLPLGLKGKQNVRPDRLSLCNNNVLKPEYLNRVWSVYRGCLSLQTLSLSMLIRTNGLLSCQVCATIAVNGMFKISVIYLKLILSEFANDWVLYSVFSLSVLCTSFRVVQLHWGTRVCSQQEMLWGGIQRTWYAVIFKNKQTNN